MKIKLSHTTNSSCSSFIVKYKDYTEGGKIKELLTPDQVLKLQDFGFKRTFATYPDQYGVTKDIPADNECYSYGYKVVCNQDEVIEFLIKNRISFTANAHYDHECYVYTGETDGLVIAQNYGIQMLMGKFRDVCGTDMFIPFKRYKGEEYIKCY